ncbi:MAG: GGDEF domain-containing protein [Alphaproteobacteria bacterium]|nr:GGDEF domain-containing protein [Alphaproteobacteria bacterium]
MKLDNLSPEQLQQWQKLLFENQVLREKVQALEAAASTSTILTRPEFVREIARMVAHDERYGGTSSLVVLSFDGLLEHKPKLGTATYDRIIQTIAECVVSGVRACDIVGRTGSNDFAVMLTRCKLPDAEKKAESLVGHLKEKLNPLLDGKAAIALTYMVSILNSRDAIKKDA